MFQKSSKIISVVSIFIFCTLFFFNASTALADEGEPIVPEVYPGSLGSLAERSSDNLVPVKAPAGIDVEYLSVDSPDSSDETIFTPRVVGGEEVSPQYAYPFMVSLQFDGEHYCGGTLLEPNWVLTAAHCWVDSDGVQFDPHATLDRAVLGEFNLLSDTGREQYLPIDEVFIHPSFELAAFKYDIALLHLSSPATLNTYVDTINVVSAYFTTPRLINFQKDTTVIGWGNTTYGGSSSNQLLEANVLFYSDNVCLSSYGAFFIPSMMLCAGLLDGSKDTCQGDSGGPIFFDYFGEYYQAGITSWGNECGLKAFPGAYAKISSASTWITEIMRPETSISVPTTVSPTGNETTPSIRTIVSWVPTAEKPLYYNVRVKDSGGSELLSRYIFASRICDETNCSWQVNQDLGDGSYSWQVRAYKVGYGLSYYSVPEDEFSVKTRITHLLPENGAIVNTHTPTFQWYFIPWGASVHQIQITDGINTYTFNKSALQACPILQANNYCSAQSPYSLPNGTYVWKMRAFKSTIGWTDFTTERTIIINAP